LKGAKGSLGSSSDNIVEWPGGRLDFSAGCLLVGVLNVTPDSFSDGGEFMDSERAVAHGVKMVEEGAAVIDVGGESTRPASAAVSAGEQIRRVVPVIEGLAGKINAAISIDTKDVEVAAAAMDAGAGIINDITALADERMGELAADQGAPVVVMHMQGTPATRAKRAQGFGIADDRIFIDPGIGFGKTLEHNLLLLKNIDRFVAGGYRVLVGTSRKSFIGKITGREGPQERIFGTAATVALCAAAGVSMVRAHDVGGMVDVVKVVQAGG